MIAAYAGMCLISWWVWGNLREILLDDVFRIVGQGSGWMNFRRWTKVAGIAVRKRSGGHM